MRRRDIKIWFKYATPTRPITTTHTFIISSSEIDIDDTFVATGSIYSAASTCFGTTTRADVVGIAAFSTFCAADDVRCSESACGGGGDATSLDHAALRQRDVEDDMCRGRAGAIS